MPSLTSCLQQAGAFISPEAKAAIGKLANRFRSEGLDTQEASKKAVSDYMKERGGSLKEIETAIDEGVTLYEIVPETPAAKAEAEAAVSRVDQVLMDMPDLMVKTDDMDAPMKAADFMAMVKAEADELAADGPLMQIAAECALLNGS